MAAILTYNQAMYGYNIVMGETLTFANTAAHTNYSGNFRGAHSIPVTLNSGRLNKTSSGVLKVNLAPYILNNGNYIRLFIKASGYTTSVVAGDIRLYFANGFYGTIQEAVDAELVDPVVFRYTSSSSTSYLWNTTNLFTGGRTDSKSYPSFSIYLKPLSELTHFEFYTNKGLNTTYDGYIIYQTDIFAIATSIDELNSKLWTFFSTGSWESEQIDAAALDILKCWFECQHVLNGGECFYYYSFYNDGEEIIWQEIINGGLMDYTGKAFLKFKVVLNVSSDGFRTPSVLSIGLKGVTNESDKIIRLSLIPGKGFRNVEGPLLLSYNDDIGNIEGAAGKADSFEESFVPEGLERKPNPVLEERIVASTNTPTPVLTSIAYHDRHGINYDTIKWGIGNASVLITPIAYYYRYAVENDKIYAGIGNATAVLSAAT